MEEKNKNLDACKFTMNEIVLCYEPDPIKARMLYDAKILDSDVTKDDKGRKVFEYYIHFQGWNKSWDRWILENQILKANEINRTTQTKLYNEAIRQKKRKTKPSSKHDSGDDKDDKSITSMGSISVSGEDDVKVIQLPMVTLDIPKVLAVRLEDDCYNIKRKKKLIHLPRKPTVNDIFNEYYAHCEKVVKTPEGRNKSLRIFYEMVYGLNTYFNYFLFSLLLYNFEREQYNNFFPSHENHIPHFSPPATPVATKIINYLISNNGSQSKDSSRSNSRASSFCEDGVSASVSAPLLKEVLKTKCGKKRRSERKTMITEETGGKRRRNNTSCSSVETNPQDSPKPRSQSVDSDKKSTRETRSHAKRPEKIFTEKVSPNAEKAIKPMEILTENIIDMARTTRSSIKSSIREAQLAKENSTKENASSQDIKERAKPSTKLNPKETHKMNETLTKEQVSVKCSSKETQSKDENYTEELSSKLKNVKEGTKLSVKCNSNETLGDNENSTKGLPESRDLKEVTKLSIKCNSNDTQIEGEHFTKLLKSKDLNEETKLPVKSPSKRSAEHSNSKDIKEGKTSPLKCSSKKTESTNKDPTSEIVNSRDLSMGTKSPVKCKVKKEKSNNKNSKKGITNTKDLSKEAQLPVKCDSIETQFTIKNSTAESLKNLSEEGKSPVKRKSNETHGTNETCRKDIATSNNLNEGDKLSVKCNSMGNTNEKSTREIIRSVDLREGTKSPTKCNSAETCSTKENSPKGENLKERVKSPTKETQSPSRNPTKEMRNLKESKEESSLKETHVASETFRREALKELTDINEESNRGTRSTKDFLLKEDEIKKEQLELEDFKSDGVSEDMRANTNSDSVTSMENGSNRLRRSMRSAKTSNTVSESDEQEVLPMGSTAKSLQETYKGPLKGKGQCRLKEYDINDKTYMIYPQHANGDTPADIYGLEHLLRLFVKLPVLLSSSNIDEAKMVVILQYASHFMEYLSKRTDLFVDSTSVYSESII